MTAEMDPNANAGDALPPPPVGSGAPAPRRPAPDNGLAQVLVTSLLVVLAFTAGWFGNAYVNRANYIPPDDVNQHVLNQAWNQINDNYVVTQNIDKRKMTYAAINAMVGTLNDPGHTRFETPEQYQAESNQLNNEKIVGIGVGLGGGGSDPITLNTVFPKTPASDAGLRPGDQVVAVNGTDVRGYTLDKVSPLIRGSEGTSVTLTIVRPSGSPPPGATPAPTAVPTPGATPTAGARFSVTLVRRAFTPPTVVSFVISDLGIADINLLDFSKNADDEVKAAIREAQKQNVKGIILDLRGNGGGLLDQSVAVTSEFVPAGPNKNVLIVKDRTSQHTEAVQPGGLATTTPLVVLVDGDTASAAEITAGAIQINRPDVHVVGQTTFGTGTILTPVTLADGSVLVLGTSEWLLPDGRSIYKQGNGPGGYQPDQPVALAKGVVAFTPLSTAATQPTLADVRKSGDAQLLQAIKDLAPGAVEKPAA